MRTFAAVRITLRLSITYPDVNCTHRCTTIASNLSIALANITKAKVALVDFSLQFGDVAVLLNLHSHHGVHELMRNVDDLDAKVSLDVVRKDPRPLGSGQLVALNNSFGFGGHNVALAFRSV